MGCIYGSKRLLIKGASNEVVYEDEDKENSIIIKKNEINFNDNKNDYITDSKKNDSESNNVEDNLKAIKFVKVKIKKKEIKSSKSH